MRCWTAAFVLFLPAFVTVGCSNSEELQPIRISGNVLLPEGASGQIHLIAFQASSLAGELKHPLHRIAEWQSSSTAFERDIGYPVSLGQGIAVFAWLDVDGDGVHCTPEFREEPAGLTVQHEIDEPITLTVELTTNCVAADWFYPVEKNDTQR